MTILFAPYAKPLRNLKRSAKNYPWPKELVTLLEAGGHTLIQIGASHEEQVCDKFLKDQSFDQVTHLLNACDTFISVDSYLQHHAWFLNRRGIVLWGQSDPLIFGHPFHINLLKDRKYLRPDQFRWYEDLECNDDAFVSPDEVVAAVPRLTILSLA